MSLKYQYHLGNNSGTKNDWGGNANQLAEWGGAVWAFTVPVTDDVVDITDESITVQYTGSAWTDFRFWVEIANASGVIETASTGTGLIGQRRLISDYNSITGDIYLASAVRATPNGGETFIVIPSTKENVVDFFNNTQVTSISSKADVELGDGGSQVQISSLLDGSSGYVQVTGGRANEQLLFSTTLKQGLQAYNYYVGLIKLVHKTIYGDELDLVSFPGVGAAGVKFQILPPTVQEVSISMEVTLNEGTSLSQVENDIKTAVISYINNLGVSQEVILSNIIDRVVSLSTVTDVRVTNPTVNVPIAENELARTKASLINVETT